MRRKPLSPPFDELDYRIITCLNRDARMPASEIERETGANQRTIRKRIERLVETGAIRLRAVVDPLVFGYVVSIDALLSVETDRQADIIAKLEQMPPITYLATGQGSDEYSIEARFPDVDSMQSFLKDTLGGIEGLEIRSYALVPRIIRNIDDWLPPEEDFGSG